VFAEKGYTEKADIYSYAITVWEMVARAEPFVGMSPQQIMIEVGTNGLRPPIPATCPAELARIIVGMLLLYIRDISLLAPTTSSFVFCLCVCLCLCLCL